MTRRQLPTPRWQTPLPPGVVGSYGPLVEAYVRRELGVELDTWQRRSLNRELAHDADGRCVHSTYLTSVGRQNGKTLRSRGLVGAALTSRPGDLPDWRSIVGLAYDRRQARIPYEAVRDDLAPMQRRLGSSGGLQLTRYLGIRSTLYGLPRRYDTLSREARDAARGTTNGLVLFDEVRTQRDFDTWAAIEPTTTAVPDSLIDLTSTAGDDRSVLLRALFDRGLRIIDGAEPAGGFGMTWYAAPDDAAPDDARAILAANPAIAEGRIPMAPVLESYRTMPPAQYRQERLNLWSDATDEWLPAGIWAAATMPQPDGFARVVLGVEAVPTWARASIVAAIATDSGAWVGVVSDIRPSRGATVDPRELIAELGRVAALWRPAGVAYSVTAATSPHVTAWAKSADVPAAALTPRDIRSASELFRAELVGGRLTHRDDALLAYQVRAARPSGPIESGDWYLSVRESAGYVDAIRAAAWAAWALLAPSSETPLQAFL